MSRAELSVPADKGLCRRIRALDILFAIVVVLGPCIAASWVVLDMMSTESRSLTIPITLFLTATTVALLCFTYRVWLLRNLRVVNQSEGRLRLFFRCEDCAREFAAMNRCTIDENPGWNN